MTAVCCVRVRPEAGDVLSEVWLSGCPEPRSDRRMWKTLRHRLRYRAEPISNAVLERAGLIMRGTDEASGSLFSYVDLEARIPVWHPLRKIRQVVNDALAASRLRRSG